MNIDGLISRATHTTGRSLLVVSSLVILSNWFMFPLAKLPIIVSAESIPKEMVTIATFGLLVFLIVTHALNWFNDYIAYQASFPLHTIKDMRKPDNLTSEGDGTPAERVWKENRKTIETSNMAQKLSLYVQHLAAPLIMGLWAFGWIYINWTSPAG